MNKLIYVFTALLVATFVNVTANKTTVEIQAPEEAEKGTEITITVDVSHNRNSRLHHTDWVYLKINDEEVRRWEYDGDSLPPDAVFTLEFKHVIEEELTIEAEGNCNLHGSTGISQFIVRVREAELEGSEK